MRSLTACTKKNRRKSNLSNINNESDYVKEHLSMFDDGITIIQTDYAYKTYSLDSGIVGIQSDNTLFVMPKSLCDDILKKANGDILYIEKALGCEPGHFSEGAWLIDVDNIFGLNLRLPNGNEHGANSYWIPGGYTSGGVPEAISDTIPLSETNVQKVY